MLVLSTVHCCFCNVTSPGAYDAGFARAPKSFGGIHVTRAVSNRRKHGTDELDWNVCGEEDLSPKPLGFGHGKSYDTSLEDEILEEIERSKTEKKASFSKRNKSAGTQRDSKTDEKGKPVNSPSLAMTVKIKVSDLPKKKNIKKDLLSAFRNVPGLLEVIPSVLGNEKTRDPICKGFAFLTFDNHDNAKSFISSYGDEPILFGKVMKRPSYRILDRDCASPVSICIDETIGSKVDEKGTISEVRSLMSDVPSFAKENGFPLSNSSSALREQVLQLQMSEVSDLKILRNEVVLDGDYAYEEDDDDSDEDYEIPEDDKKSQMFFRENQKLDVVDNILKHNEDCNRTVESDVNESEKRINELENRLRKKLEEGRLAVGTDKRQTAAARGFKVHGSKRNPTKGNNLMAMTTRLKKNERTIMIGVLEKYGKHQTNRTS